MQFPPQFTLCESSLRHLPLLVDDHVTPHDFGDYITTPLARLLGLVFYMPYEWRKLLFDITRIQSFSNKNRAIMDRLQAIQQRSIPIPSHSNMKRWKRMVDAKSLGHRWNYDRYPVYTHTKSLRYHFITRMCMIHYTVQTIQFMISG